MMKATTVTKAHAGDIWTVYRIEGGRSIAIYSDRRTMIQCSVAY